jgi:hypothetical protein
LKYSKHFIKLIQEINLQNEDCLVSFDAINLFTTVPVGQVLQVIINRLIMDPFSQNVYVYRLKTLELFDICSATAYFQFEDKLPK